MRHPDAPRAPPLRSAAPVDPSQILKAVCPPRANTSSLSTVGTVDLNVRPTPTPRPDGRARRGVRSSGKPDTTTNHVRARIRARTGVCHADTTLRAIWRLESSRAGTVLHVARSRAAASSIAVQPVRSRTGYGDVSRRWKLALSRSAPPAADTLPTGHPRTQPTHYRNYGVNEWQSDRSHVHHYRSTALAPGVRHGGTRASAAQALATAASNPSVTRCSRR